MEYTIDGFVASIRERMYQLFPFESDEINKVKHKKRQGHIRDIAFMNLPVIAFGSDEREFNIGSDLAEEKYPYYHILQQAPVIRKKYKGTKKSKGSQAEIKVLKDRDYEKITWNGKTFTKEYTRNVRGQRSSVMRNATIVKRNASGQKLIINKNANSYVNIHYQYIDKILDEITPLVAAEYNMRLARKMKTSLESDYIEDREYSFFQMFDSFN